MTLEQLLDDKFSDAQLRNNSSEKLAEYIEDDEELLDFVEENDIDEQEILTTLDQIRDQRITEVDLDELDTDPERGDPIDLPVIGEHYSESVNARVYINGYEYYLLDLRLTQDIRTDADYGRGVIYPKDDVDDEDAPNYDDRIEIESRLDDLYIDQDVDFGDTTKSNVYGEWHTIFTGRLNNVRYLGNGQFHIEFSNASNELIYEEITVDYTDDLISVQQIVEDIVTDKISRPLDKNDVIFDNFDDEEIGEGDLEVEDSEITDVKFVDKDDVSDQESGFRVKPEDTQIRYRRENEKVADILDELAAFTMSRWWIDEYNQFHFGKPGTQIREIEFITDHDTGLLTPPYRSVQVITDPVVAEEGWSQEQLKSYNNAVLTGRITNPGSEEPDIVLNEVQEPVFTYKNLDIKTPEQAKNVTIELLEELAEQLEEGEIEVVGRPDISVYDVIVLPDYLSEQGQIGKEMSVGGLTHKINPDDGFITVIEPFHILGTDTEIKSVRDDLQFQRPDDERETTDGTDIRER